MSIGSDFFRFPHTPHIAWLGEGVPRDDKVLSRHEADLFLSEYIVIEEKIDGANLGLSVDEDGMLRAQNRGAYIDLSIGTGQFSTLASWLTPRQDRIAEALFPDLMLFGEWCRAVHSVRYTALPDWFLVFDVYDRSSKSFWNSLRRNEFASSLGLATVPLIQSRSRQSLDSLTGLLGKSAFSDGLAEGMYLRREDDEQTLARAKLVRPEFIQQIGDHWSKKSIETNQLAGMNAWH